MGLVCSVHIDVIAIWQAVAFYFLHRGFRFSQDAESLHLVQGVLLADLAHRETYVNQHPVSRLGTIVLKKTEIYLASHAHDIDDRRLRVICRDLDDFPRNR